MVIDYLSHPEVAEELERQLAALGEDQVIGVDADVSKVADLQMLVDRAVDRFGGLDIMVNNAGVETRTNVLDTTEAQYGLRPPAADRQGPLTDRRYRRCRR